MTVVAWTWALVVAVIAAVALSRRLRAPPAGQDARRVVLARPCAGDEPGLADRLAVCPPGVDAVRITVAREADRAASMDEAVARLRSAGVDAAVCVVPTTARNRKCGQLAGLAETLGDAILVNADSDVDLSRVDLRLLIDPLRGSGSCAATWAPCVESRGTTFADRASEALLGGSLHAFPLLAALDPQGLVGKVFAARLDRLPNGLAALAGHVGEDMALAAAARQAGYRTSAVPLVVAARPWGRTWAEVVARYTRWLAVIRWQRPALLASYPLLFCATAPVVALSWAAGAPAAALLAVGARLAVAVGARRAAGLPTGPLDPLVDAVLADVLLSVAFVRACMARQVTWRGRVLEGPRAG